MAVFQGNLRDTEFVLWEYLQVADILEQGPFSHVQEQDAKMILAEALRFAENVSGELYVEGDRQGCLYQDGKVITPYRYKEAYQKYIESEWHTIAVDPEDGGAGLPPSIVWAITEFLTASNIALKGLTAGADFGNIIKICGTQQQIQRFCPGLFSGRWGGAMALTEPDAGSDVGAIKTKARKIEGEIYAIEGTKRFITCGDQDISENIITLALARVEGAPSGTEGLSMFIIPKIWVNRNGSLGEMNDVGCAGIEHKMGLKASPTCQMNYGENGQCRGILVGNQEGIGMKQMFHLINTARMLTGVQALGQATSAYFHALNYAKTRLQGRDIAKSSDKNASRIPIIEHPDVKRMLLEQKSKLEGMRGLILKTAHLMDQTLISKSKGTPGEEGLIDILTPIIKAYCSEEAFQSNNLALQVLGGSGYCMDYPIEQYLRDTRITSIYEGTTHIQAMDFIRKARAKQGKYLSALFKEIETVRWRLQEGGAFQEEAELLAGALGVVNAQAELMLKYSHENIKRMALHANNFLLSVSETLVASILLDMAVVAQEKRERQLPSDDAFFYTGKIYSAKFYTHYILPNVFSRQRIMATPDTSALDIAVASF